MTRSWRCAGFPIGVNCDQDAIYPKGPRPPYWCEDHETLRRASIDTDFAVLAKVFGETAEKQEGVS